MPANTVPVFPNVLRNSNCQISTANTARDGTGTIGTVFTAGANGSRITRIVIKATGTVTAGMIRLFIDDGVNVRLYDEIDVTAATPSGTVKAFRYSIYMPSEGALLLEAGEILKASTHNAETFNVFAEGGDY